MKKAYEFLALMPSNCLVPHDRFPSLLEAFLQQNPSTPDLEQSGQHLKNANFGDEIELEQFIAEVCKWGGYSGIAARVIRHNGTGAIADAFRDAMDALATPTPDIEAALTHAIDLQHLGVSFASKHLRFLCPQCCPVLDSIISQRIVSDPKNGRRYPLTVPGYGEFARDCASIAAELTSDRSPHPPKLKRDVWYAADVEASLYAFLNRR